MCENSCLFTPFWKSGHLFKSNIMVLYWTSDIIKSKSAGKQGTKRQKSSYAQKLNILSNSAAGKRFLLNVKDEFIETKYISISLDPSVKTFSIKRFTRLAYAKKTFGETPHWFLFWQPILFTSVSLEKSVIAFSCC